MMKEFEKILRNKKNLDERIKNDFGE